MFYSNWDSLSSLFSINKQKQNLKNKLYKTIEEFNSKDSDLAKQNANFVQSISVLEHLLIEEVSKNYLFDVIYKDISEIRELHESGVIYHHQTSKLSPYCIGISSYDIALRGLCSNASNDRKSKPPKRIDTFLSQCANLICLLGQEVSGATSLNDISNIAAGYLYHLEKNLNQNISDYELKNNFQSFLYNINLPFRAGNSPFSNITLDFSKPSPQIKDKIVVYAGTYIDITYEQIPSVYFDRINKAFIDAMVEGDSLGNPFTFPLITVNITDDFDYENEGWKYLLENADNFGGFYLQNYCTKPFTEEARKINPYHYPYDLGMLYSNCCRMIFNLNDVKNMSSGSPFSSHSGVGGIGVITINLNRVLWETKGDEKKCKEKLDELLNVCARALEEKRKWIKQNWTFLYPYLSFYVKNPDNLFSILSVAGAHEGLVSIGYKDGIFNKQGRNLLHKIARHIRNKIDEFSDYYKTPFSLEYAPIETASGKMAIKDLYYCLVKEDQNSKEGE